MWGLSTMVKNLCLFLHYRQITYVKIGEGDKQREGDFSFSNLVCVNIEYPSLPQSYGYLYLSPGYPRKFIGTYTSLEPLISSPTRGLGLKRVLSVLFLVDIYMK